ncbi:MBL fold metallo-hydrolase [Bacteroidota bacterium]
MKKMIFLIISALLLNCNPASSIGEQNSTPSSIEDNQAAIHFLGHCGFAVQTENYFLIFDYVEESIRNDFPAPQIYSLETGYINPDEIQNLKTRVFVTHQHTDHYDPVILNWENNISDIEYFFGWQAFEEDNYNYLVGQRAEHIEEDLRVYTINSHHSGVPEVAYLILVDGLTIYFNGDYQGEYVNDFQYLKTKTEFVDLAFVPPVWEDRWEYYSINTELINQFQPRALFPMHVRVGDEENYFPQFEEVFQPMLENGSVVITNNFKGVNYTYNSGIIE